MRNASAFAVAMLFTFIVLGVVACEINVWRECRTTNSWFYCVRVLNK